MNGPVHTLAKIIGVVVGSAAEGEIGANYLAAQDAAPISITLEELGHPQASIPIQLDNTTAEGFANGNMKQRRSKSMDMRWYWIKDRVRQGQFLVYYRQGETNLGDPFTKHHTPSHILKMKPKFVRSKISEAIFCSMMTHHLVRGCVSCQLDPRPSTTRPVAPRLSVTRGIAPYLTNYTVSTRCLASPIERS